MPEILLRNLALLDVDAGVLRPRHEVLLRDRHIVAVREGRIDAPGARVIDLGGRTVMPGLIDCHVHVCSDGMTAYPSIFPAMLAARASRIMRETLMRGFTTIRDAGGADMGYRQAVEAGLFVGPRLFVAGRPISQTGGHGDWRAQADPCAACACAQNATMHVIADGVDEVRRAVREEIRRGADQIKIMASGGVASPADPIDYVQYSMPELRGGGRRGAARQALRDGARLHRRGHRPRRRGRRAHHRARQFPRRGDGGDDGGARRLPGADPDRLSPHPHPRPRGRRVGAASREGAAGVRDRHALAGDRAARRGQDGLRHRPVPRAQGVPGRGVPGPRRGAAAGGVIRSATIVGAEIVRMEGRLGRVAEGHLADLLAVDGDPLADLGLLQDQGAHLSLIIKDGAIVKDAT